MDDTTRRHQLAEITLTTQADLHRMWELLIHPLGFRAASLWVTVIGSDRRPTPLLLEIGEVPRLPSAKEVGHLYDVFGHLVRDEGEGASVAFLLARPGRDGLTDLDRRFARQLLDGARAAGVPLEPLHVATDVAVHAVAPDDLAA